MCIASDKGRGAPEEKKQGRCIRVRCFLFFFVSPSQSLYIQYNCMLLYTLQSLLMGRWRRRHLNHQNIFIGAIGGTRGVQCLHVNDVVTKAARCASWE